MVRDVKLAVGEERPLSAYDVAAFRDRQARGAPMFKPLRTARHPVHLKVPPPGTFESAVALIGCSIRHPQLLAILLLFYEFF